MHRRAGGQTGQWVVVAGMLEVASCRDGIVDVAHGDDAEDAVRGGDPVHRHRHPPRCPRAGERAHLTANGFPVEHVEQSLGGLAAVVEVHQLGGDLAQYLAPIPAEHRAQRL